MSKKPDQIVFNEDAQKYDASLTPFPTSVGAPKIEMTDITHWKNNTVHKVNHQLSAKFEEIKAAYEALTQQYEYNKLIYEAQFNFEPVVGKIYHLYKRANEQTFLSILAPAECNFTYVKSFKLNADGIWELG